MTNSDWQSISTAAKISQIENSENGSISFGLYDLGENNIRKVDLTKVKNWNLKEQILNTLTCYAQNPNIVKVLLDLKNYYRTKDEYNKNWQIPEHYLNRLTLEQLDKLGMSDDNTNNDYTFRRIQFSKRFNADLYELNTTQSVSRQRELLVGLLEKIREDKNRDNTSLISTIYEALLNNGYEMEIYDPSILREYLKRPIYRHGQFTDEFWRKVGNSSDWRSFINYRTININQPSLETVFIAYLNEIVSSESIMNEFNQYFNSSFLKGIFLTNKVLKGGSLEEYKAHFGENAANELENKKNLEIVRRNKR